MVPEAESVRFPYVAVDLELLALSCLFLLATVFHSTKPST